MAGNSETIPPILSSRKRLDRKVQTEVTENETFRALRDYFRIERYSRSDRQRSRDLHPSRTFLNSASTRRKVILQQLTDSDDLEDLCLPRLKDDKAICIANEESPEEHGWQQAVHLYFGNILPRGCGR